MVEWKDESSHSRKDTERVPNRFVAHIGKVRLYVHRHIHYPPDVWLTSCVPDLFSCRALSSKDIDEAKRQAVAVLQAECETVIERICNE